MKQTHYSLSKRRQLLAASALVPIIGALSRPPTLQALIYTFFVCVYLAPFVIKEKHQGSPTRMGTETVAGTETGTGAAPSMEGSSLADRANEQIKLLAQSRHRSFLNFGLALVGSGLVSECLVWVSQLFAATASPAAAAAPAQVPIQLFAHLFFAIFYYAGVALAWLLLLTHWHFALKEIFLLSFLVALLKQAQLGTLSTICQGLINDPISALFTLATLLVVGGSIASLGFLAAGKVWPQEKKPDMAKVLIKYFVSLILIALLPELTGLGGSLIARPLGLCPGQKPIWEAPLL